MKSLVHDIVIGTPVTVLQGVATQNASGSFGTTAEITTLQNSITYIESIITVKIILLIPHFLILVLSYLLQGSWPQRWWHGPCHDRCHQS